MKKSNLLILLAIPMVLAACGKKGNSSSINGTSLNSDIPTSEISSDAGSSIQSSTQSSSPENEGIEKTEYEKFVEGFDVARDAKIKFESTPRTSTITETLCDKYYSYNDVTPVAGEPTHNESVDVYNDWYIRSYDALSKTGYIQNDDDYSFEQGVRSEYNVSWVQKYESDYRFADLDEKQFQTVGEGYAWSDVLCRTDSFDYLAVSAATKWKNEITAAYSYLFNMNVLINNVGAEFAGSYTTDVSILADLKTEAGVTTFSYKISAKTNYVAPTLPSTLGTDDYLTKASETYESERSYSIKNGEICGTTYSYNYCESQELKNVDGVKTTKDGHDYSEKLEFTSKYTSREFPSTTGLTDVGTGSVQITVFDDVYNTMDSFYQKIGSSLLYGEDNILSTEEKDAGVTVKFYEDAARTKEIKLDTFVTPGNSVDIYASYVVPNDVALVIYECLGIFDGYGEMLYTNYQISEYEHYVGEAKKNYYIPAYSCPHAYNNAIGKYVDALMAPFDTILVYSTDENAKMKNDRMIDIKEGYIYYLSSYAMQIA
ncbi:MAG: hypothetical protein MJ238_02290 [Bacilli bacterium]|nr:hypothetical protein [Bacilli bacterium]